MAKRICGLLTTSSALVLTTLIIVSPFAVAYDQPPRECQQNASSDTGQPVMFQRGRLMWGLSTKPIAFGQKLPVVLWIYNPTAEPLPVWTCEDIDFFWLRDIQVFDSTGKRIESRREQKRRVAVEQSRSEGRPFPEEVWVCSRNFPITIPSHACLHGSLLDGRSDLARDLNEYYLLPPGQYSLVPTKAPEMRTVPPTTNAEQQRVAITVTKP
jgi:hypothetical protein